MPGLSLFGGAQDDWNKYWTAIVEVLRNTQRSYLPSKGGGGMFSEETGNISEVGYYLAAAHMLSASPIGCAQGDRCKYWANHYYILHYDDRSDEVEHMMAPSFRRRCG